MIAIISKIDTAHRFLVGKGGYLYYKRDKD